MLEEKLSTLRGEVRNIAKLGIATLMLGSVVINGCSLYNKKDHNFPVKDGKYDNNTFLVDTRKMSLGKIIESLYSIKTTVQFLEKKYGKEFYRQIGGTGIVLFDRYLLTAEHVIEIEPPSAIVTPMGQIKIDVQKIDSYTCIEVEKKCHPLEEALIDKETDIALFRIPEHLNLKSFPYKIGNSDELEVGNYVYSIGSPTDFGVNVREGIVSSLKAPKIINEIDSNPENAFMVSNGLNPGDSGTPIVAIMDGVYHLVGISQGTFMRRQRLGWAIGINKILRKIEAAIKQDKLRYAESGKNLARGIMNVNYAH